MPLNMLEFCDIMVPNPLIWVTLKAKRSKERWLCFWSHGTFLKSTSCAVF